MHCLGGAPASSHVQSCTPMVVTTRTPATALACMPTVDCGLAASLAPTNLRAELDHHRSGEDGCTNIERQRERHRNLDGDFDTPIAAPQCVLHTSLALRDLWGMHDTCPPPPDSGLAVQVSATPPKEVRHVSQPRLVPVDLHHCHPYCRRE
jgi:hypothetical protein